MDFFNAIESAGFNFYPPMSFLLMRSLGLGQTFPLKTNYPSLPGDSGTMTIALHTGGGD